ncbi:tetratricopeptide repeat protein [Acuticoccus sediminis]|nr:tetratricopeptide repeat protein [Acuticoccus sediminis]
MVVFSLCSAASAQTGTSGPSALEARRDQLFLATLNDPDNLDVAFEYALISAKLGDYEGAIATLERILVFAPNLPRVQLELGVLYYRIGARDMARSYLEAVAAQPNLPAPVRERVESFLGAITKQDRRLVMSAQVVGGVQYQTNANAAPGDDTVVVNGIPVVLNNDARATADWNVFSLARVHFSYDLRNQGDLIEVDVTNYNSVFFDMDQLSLNLIEAQVGPSFSLGRVGLDTSRIGVYGILGANALGYSMYSGTYGAGVRLQSSLADNILYDGRAEVRALNYDNSDDYPTVRLQTGQEYRASGRITGLWSPQWITSLALGTRIVDAREDFKSFAELNLIGNVTYRFFGPNYGPLEGSVPWELSLTGGATYRPYWGPDPVLDPGTTEEDVALWAEAGISVPMEHDFAAFFTSQIRHQASNYDTREYTNAIFTLGLSRRF